jgi:hypothetical protein
MQGKKSVNKQNINSLSIPHLLAVSILSRLTPNKFLVTFPY